MLLCLTHVSLRHTTGIPGSCMAWPARMICSEPTVVSNTLNCARLENNMEQCVNRCNPQHSADCANWNNASLVATVNSIVALEQEKHYCQSGSGCLSLSKGSLHVWLSVIWWPLTDLKALLQSGQVLLDHPSAAFPPLFLQSSKNHLISSVHCGSLQIK